MLREHGKQKCSWSTCELLQNKNHPDVLNMLYFKCALLSPQLALREAARWKAQVTKTTCLKDNFREINQREHDPAPQVWDQSRGHTQLQLHVAPEKSQTAALLWNWWQGHRPESSSEWKRARVIPLPSVKFPVRVMITNTLPSGSKSTWKKRKGNVRRLFSLRQKFDNIWMCIYSNAHLNWKKKKLKSSIQCPNCSAFRAP